MNREVRPSWLVRQENGTIGEARSRAFLLDRFWILERSVDVEGADLIIQRRLTERSLLDRVPPRLGFVQAKYYATVDTTHYIHSEYVVDPDGAPRDEFFLVAHTGAGDGAVAYCLTAHDIVENFCSAPQGHSHEGRYVVPGRLLLTPRFQIMNRSAVLDRMERALGDADFRKNRFFLSWALPSRTVDSPPIQPAFHEAIPTWWGGDIPKHLQELRRSAALARWDVQEVGDMLKEIEETDDPARALAMAEELSLAWGNRVTFDDLFDEDFFNAVCQHQERYKQLVATGTLGAFPYFQRAATEYMLTNLAPKMPVDNRQVYVLHVSYDPDTLLGPQFVGRMETTDSLWPAFQPERFSTHPDIPATEGIVRSRAGEIEAYLVPGRWSYDLREHSKKPDADKRPFRERIDTVVGRTVAALMLHVLDVRFGEL